MISEKNLFPWNVSKKKIIKKILGISRMVEKLKLKKFFCTCCQNDYKNLKKLNEIPSWDAIFRKKICSLLGKTAKNAKNRVSLND